MVHVNTYNLLFFISNLTPVLKLKYELHPNYSLK